MGRLLESIRHSPRRSNLCSSTLGRHEAAESIEKLSYAGNLNDSPLVSTAQAILAFFAAIATTAFL